MFRVIGIISGLMLAAGAAVFLTGEERHAEAQVSYPAAYYSGAILVDGAAPASGGIIVAERSNGWKCGEGTVYFSGGAAFYQITVNSWDTAFGCFNGGDPIVFKFKGMTAQQIPGFSNWGSQVVHLTFKSTRYFQCTPELCPISSQPVFVLPPQR
jgi:hypothetical protein